MSKEQFMRESLREGEVYAGLLLGKNGAPDQHLFLLPGEVEKATWAKAKEWAEKEGGRLPTRQEQSLLFANAKDEFKAAWYWSGEQHSDSLAWGQTFNYGFQNYYYKTNEFRARAVRTIQLSASVI